MIAVLLGAVAVITGAAAGGLPYFDVPTLNLGLEIQPFGMLVATGVLLGAEVCRRYAIKYGIDDDDLRKLTGWVVVSGFIGAHVFDVLAYQREEFASDPLLILKLWHGISSYGGFLGGAMGFSAYVWYRRFNVGLMADVIVCGLLIGFTIGRVGCTIVHDHIGATTDFALGFDYPWKALYDRRLLGEFPGITQGMMVRAHNLGFYELLYLIPVNILVLGLAFRRKKPLAAGFLAVLTGVFYAPVRFFLEYLRLSSSDPRYAGLTFAQWMSILALSIAVYVAIQLARKGKPATLAADLGDRVGGYREGVVAPKRVVVAEADTDDDKGASAKSSAAKSTAKKKR